MASVKTEVIDNDEVVIRYTGLKDFDGDEQEVVLRLRLYEDVKDFTINVETDADSKVVLEASNANNIDLVFSDIEFTDDWDTDGLCTASCSCQCDTGECDCNPQDGDEEECECCGDTPCVSDCDEECGYGGCVCSHCSCYPDSRCCFCQAVDSVW